MRREEVNKRKGLRGGKEWMKGKEKVRDKKQTHQWKKKGKKMQSQKIKKEESKSYSRGVRVKKKKRNKVFQLIIEQTISFHKLSLISYMNTVPPVVSTTESSKWP